MPDDDLLERDLEEWLTGSSGPAGDEAHEVPERPADEVEAARLMRWVRSIDRETARVKKLAADNVAQVKAWEDDRLGGLLDRRARLVRSLEGWMRVFDHSTRTFPAGKLSLRNPGGSTRTEITDEAAVVKWAQENSRLDLLKLTGSKSAIAAATKPGPDAAWPDETETAVGLVITTGDCVGEIVPGVVQVRPRRKTFSLTITDPVQPKEEHHHGRTEDT